MADMNLYTFFVSDACLFYFFIFLNYNRLLIITVEYSAAVYFENTRIL